MSDFFYLLSIVFYGLGYFVFFKSLLIHKTIRISYTFGLFVFLTIQYGPHTVLFTDMLRLSLYAENESVNTIYNFLLAFVFLFFGVMFSILPAKYSIAIGRDEVRDFSYSGYVRYRNLVFMFFCIILIFSLYLQGGGKIALDHIKFIFGKSFFTYKEIRRELFDGSAWFNFTNLVRFSVVPVIYSYLFVLGLLSSKKNVKKIYFCLSIAFLMFSVVQLNKFFFLYYLILSILLILSFEKLELAKLKVTNMSRIFFLVLIGGPLFLGVLLFLYKFQYSNAISSGLIVIEDILDTLMFRVFFASSDSLRLWIDYFGIEGNYKGFSIIGKGCKFFGECFNPNTFIPYYYLGRELTSMQAGFLGTALGFGGFFAVPFVTMLVILIVVINNYMLASIKSSHMVTVASSVMFLNSFFLTTRELHTAILSGGAFLTVLFITLIVYRIKI